jgi:hypothetical protein
MQSFSLSPSTFQIFIKRSKLGFEMVHRFNQRRIVSASGTDELRSIGRHVSLDCASNILSALPTGLDVA